MADETCCFEKKFRLPDGSFIKLGRYKIIIINYHNIYYLRERFEATELLFNPAVDGLESKGTSHLVFKSINVI